MLDIIVREMTKEDIDAVVEIEKESFSIPWTKDAFLESFQYDHAHFFVAISTNENEKIVGYAGLYKIFNEADITNIAVKPEYRGKSIGKALLNSCISFSQQNNIENIMLEVRKSNEAARSLYEKTGFIKIGERKRFYEKPVEDAIVMAKNILN